MSPYERRELIGPGEIRAESTADGRTILRGLAAPFDTLSGAISEEGRTFRELIRPGAFARSLAARPVVALAGHRTWPPLGSTRAGTLALRETDRGLEFELDPPATETGREVIEAARRGDLGGMSFGFNPANDGESWEQRDGMPLHVLREVELYEISFVTWPAYPRTNATAAVRSLIEWERSQVPTPPPTPRADALRAALGRWTAAAR